MVSCFFASMFGVLKKHRITRRKGKRHRESERNLLRFYEIFGRIAKLGVVGSERGVLQKI